MPVVAGEASRRGSTTVPHLTVICAYLGCCHQLSSEADREVAADAGFASMCDPIIGMMDSGTV